MSYTHSKYEVEMVPILNAAPSVGGALWPTSNQTGVQLSITGVRAVWAPGFVPHIIKAAAVMPTVTTVMTDDVFVGFNADISVAGTPTRLFTINLPTSGVLGHKAVYHRVTRFIEILPGQKVECAVTAAATAGVYGKVILYVEPRWEEPENVTSMLAST